MGAGKATTDGDEGCGSGGRWLRTCLSFDSGYETKSIGQSNSSGF